MKGKVLFISGIDTNIGKTYATGILARALAEKGKTVITQKMIQTGCTEISEDIEMHRQSQIQSGSHLHAVSDCRSRLNYFL